MSEQDYSSARLLIVDDEEANVRVLERMLARAGYRNLASTQDSREFERLFDETQPDLVLLDLLMPHIDGYAILDQLRQRTPQGIYLPVLVLTADATPRALQRALSAGARDFLTKPFDQTELLLRVRNLLETRYLYLGLQQQVTSLSQLYDGASQSLQIRDESLTAVSHDINQPLTALRLTTEGIEQQLRLGRSQLDATLVEDLHNISAATKQMTAMIGELADVACLQMGRALALNRGRLDLVRLAAEQVAIAQKATRRHRIRLDSSVEELQGDWDEVRIGRVISNLLDNAVKFSPRGGDITVTVATLGTGAGTTALLSISDHGLGIPEADLPNIFQRFYRASAVARTTQGAGIGLASVKHIVEQHGGSIEVETHAGQGTTFKIALPAG